MKSFLTAVLIASSSHAIQAATPERPKIDRAGRTSQPQKISTEVQKALEAELAGDNDRRNSILAAYGTEHPEDDAAQWHQGMVRTGNEWLLADRVADCGNRWQELYDYRQEREKRGNTVDDQLYLADGCRHHKLFDEERAHLMQVVALDYGHAEARARLGDVATDGRWINFETARRAYLASQRWNDGVATHGAAAQRFIKNLRQSRMTPERTLARFDAWRSPEKIGALEQSIGDSGDFVQAGYIQWLGTFPSYEASQALVRQVLFSEHPEMRVLATEKVKDRPADDYMRELIASLHVVRSAPTPQANNATATHWAAFSLASLDQEMNLELVLRNPVERIRVLELPGVQGFEYTHREFGNALTQLWQSRLIALSASDEMRTQRALRLISDVSGAPAESVSDVWGWWERSVDGPEQKEMVSLNYDRAWYVDTRTRRIRPTPRQSVRQKVCPPGSCLAAGTLVTTETGSRAIESIEVGDRVLSQDVESGELIFKPVLAKTTRSGATLTRVKVGDDEVVCSQGHPFWVNTIGWVQARSLQSGMPLHMTTGAVEVKETSSAGVGTVHNIVVADSHTYFVGKSNAFLSHDITPRHPTNALVPGLQPDWELTAVLDRPLSAQ